MSYLLGGEPAVAPRSTPSWRPPAGPRPVSRPGGCADRVRTDALLLDQQLALSLGTRELPAPAPGEALVRVAWAGVCGSDLHVLETGAWVAYWPATLGHEVAGVVQDCPGGEMAPGPGGGRLSPAVRGLPRVRDSSIALSPHVVAGRGPAGWVRPPPGRPGAQPGEVPGTPGASHCRLGRAVGRRHARRIPDNAAPRGCPRHGLRPHRCARAPGTGPALAGLGRARSRAVRRPPPVGPGPGGGAGGGRRRAFGYRRWRRSRLRPRGRRRRVPRVADRRLRPGRQRRHGPGRGPLR